MIRRFLRQVASENRLVATVALAATVLGVVAFVYFVRTEINSSTWEGISNGSASIVASAIGILVTACILARALASDLLLIFYTSPNVIGGTGLLNRKYDLEHLLDRRTERFYLIGQNHGSIFREGGPASALVRAVIRNPKLRLFLIFTLPAIMYSFDDGPNGLERSVYPGILRRVLKFYYQDIPRDARERVSIHFHPGATSLSAMIRDPHREQRARLVFIAKWAKGNGADRRVYCVVDKEENPDMFESLMDNVQNMTDPGPAAKDLLQVAQEEGIDVRPFMSLP